jgi:hypothetical protein
VSFESEYNLWCKFDVNNIWGVKIKSKQVYFLKELKTKNSDKVLKTLLRGDNRVSKLYNCSNKPVSASEERLVSEYCSLFLFECTPTFILYHQHSACWSGLFNYFLLCRILGGGLKIFVDNFWVDNFVWGGYSQYWGVAPPPPKKKSIYDISIEHFIVYYNKTNYIYRMYKKIGNQTSARYYTWITWRMNNCFSYSERSGF